MPRVFFCDESFPIPTGNEPPAAPAQPPGPAATVIPPPGASPKATRKHYADLRAATKLRLEEINAANRAFWNVKDR